MFQYYNLIFIHTDSMYTCVTVNATPINGVGARVGTPGCFVGLAVGTAVGSLSTYVGISVGTRTGGRVGIVVGEAVGCLVGLVVGCWAFIAVNKRK